METSALFIVARGKAAKLLESGEAALNAVTKLVKLLVVATAAEPIRFRRDHRLGSTPPNVLHNDVGVIGLCRPTRLRPIYPPKA